MSYCQLNPVIGRLMPLRRCGQLTLFNSWDFVWCLGLLECWIRSLFESVGFGRSLWPGKPSNSPRRISFICSFVVLGPIWERQLLLQDTCLAIFYTPNTVYCLSWYVIKANLSATHDIWSYSLSHKIAFFHTNNCLPGFPHLNMAIFLIWRWQNFF